MTKHISGSARTKRFVLMMTTEEYRAIEDYRFANRIGTMAETVRLLCADALARDGDVSATHKTSGEA